jgi:hypothetical protein
VQANIKKREKAEHAAKADEVGELEQFAKGCDAKGKNQKAERPVAGGVLKEFDGIGAQAVVQGTINKTDKRDEAKQEDSDFGPLADKQCAHSGFQA